MLPLIIGCLSEPLFTEDERKRILRMRLEASPPADRTNAYSQNPDAVSFGEALFFDTRLSQNGEISCATCHDPELGWADGLQQSEGLSTTPRHSMTLYGAGHQRWLLWDGACDTLWCQAIGPLEKDGEMGLSRVELAKSITAIPEHKQQYEALFGSLPDVSSWPESGKPNSDPESPDAQRWNSMREDEQRQATTILVNIVKAIAAFEETIVPPPAPIDEFVDAFIEDEAAALDLITPQEEEGLRLFVGVGQCHFCHSGSLFSDLEFHNVGLPIETWLETEDLGRYDGVTSLQESSFNAASIWSDAPDGEKANRIDRLWLNSELLGQYKTPTLRQIAETAPYMHGGQLETLDAVVQHYNSASTTPLHGHMEDLMLPLELTNEQVGSLVAFLELLTAE